VVRQLPVALPDFAGRAETLAALDRWLDRAGRGVVAISGTAGVGKTTLAIHWAHRLIDRFPDGQLHLNLRGFDPGAAPVPAAEALRTFLGALGVEPARIPAGLDAQAARYRSCWPGSGCWWCSTMRRPRSRFARCCPAAPVRLSW
jgi:hypothetical protein